PEAIDVMDLERLRALVEPGAFNTGLPAWAVLQADGQALLSFELNGDSSAYEALTPQAGYGNLDFVQQALRGAEDQAGDKYAGLVATENGQYFFVSGPVYASDGSVAGAVLTGISLQQLSRQVREETLAQISFY